MTLSNAVLITKTRLYVEEQKKPKAYNDATGAAVTCRPHGNLSIGVGINLENGLDPTEIEWLLEHRLTQTESTLLMAVWYQNANDSRKSVFLDAAYNLGVEGLLKGFPACIEAAREENWTECANQLRVVEPNVDASRYAPLRKIIISGVTP